VPAAHGTLVEILDDYPESEVVPDAHRLLARLYQHEMQDPGRAIPHYRAALQSEKDPDRSRAIHLSLGECHYRLEQLKEAAAAYEQAVALPYDAPADAAYFRLATLSRLASDEEGTLRWLDELATRTADPARRQTALLLEVETLLSLERFGDARYRLSQAERLAPFAPENADLHARLDAAEGGRRPMDDESDSFLKLQERIHWGSGRRVN
jgi:tetratricopeptide (TPR) repeat protein